MGCVAGAGWRRRHVESGIAIKGADRQPTGLSQKLTVSTGMIGQSLGRVVWVVWWIPITYDVGQVGDRCASNHRLVDRG